MNQTSRYPAIAQATSFESYFYDNAWEAVAVEICRRHTISYTELNRAEAGENVVFLIDNSFVVKIFDWFSRYSRELRALTVAQGRSQIKIPSLLYNGEINGWFYVVTTQLAGRALYTWKSVATHDQLETVSAVGVALRQLHSWEVGLTATEAVDIDISLGRIERKLALALDRETVRKGNSCWLGTLPGFINKHLCLLPNDYGCSLAL
jgi:hygromycin-B 7''-O-kinase